jgi:Flp pilus assembly protein TadG
MTLWRHPKPRGWRSLGRHQGGAAAIEFGLLAVPFFMIVGATLETALVFLSSQILDSAVQDAARLIRTGQAHAPNFEREDFRASICQRTYGMFGDCSDMFIDVAPISNFSSAVIAPPVDRTCTADCDWTENEDYDEGETSSYVLVQVYYRWPVMLNFVRVGTEDLADGSRLMGSAIVFRNEPF